MSIISTAMGLTTAVQIYALLPPPKTDGTVVDGTITGVDSKGYVGISTISYGTLASKRTARPYLSDIFTPPKMHMRRTLKPPGNMPENLHEENSVTTLLLTQVRSALLVEARSQLPDMGRCLLLYAIVKAIDALLRYEAVRE